MPRLDFPLTARVAVGTVLCWLAALLPAAAQYGRPAVADPALGEQYHVELVLDFWRPTLDATVSSESLGLLGSDIDAKADLGYVDKTIREFRLVFRPARKHRFRIAYTPVHYTGDVILDRTIVFNGIAFKVGLPVQTEFKWNTWRFGYEYDFVYTDRGFVGFFVEARQTTASVSLTSPVDSEYTKVRGPVPALGGIARVYPHRNVSITGEFSGFKLPRVQDYEGDFFDFDLYATVNLTNNVGVQGGFRTLDASYVAKSDTGNLKLKGLYFAGVVRF
jgi:hypothetical protein